MDSMKLSEKLKFKHVDAAHPPATQGRPAAASEHAVDLRHEDDEVLVKRTQRGEAGAFDILVERYKERLYATVYHMTGNHEDANDLVQEAFIKAYKSLPGFRGHSSFYTWIYRIAARTAISTAWTTWTTASRPTRTSWS
jgi:hypothetical protein